MFFFIGGIQPKTVTLDDTPRLCPVCGLAQARLRRVDNYLSLFFIPILRVKRGDPVVICDRCGAMTSPDEPLRPSHRAPYVDTCPSCGYGLRPEYRYCPRCGAQV